MRELIIGYGQVGKAVHEAICPEAETYDLQDDLAPSQLAQLPGELDVLHVCLPYSANFVEDVKEYIASCRPKHIVVYSTIPIGTCREIGNKVVHSPIEGVHPQLADSIMKMNRFIGYNDGSEGKFFVHYFHSLGIPVEHISKTEATELIKLRSTARYGINLAFAQYETELCEKFGVTYTDLMSYDRAYNRLYEELGDIDARRYVLYPPGGKIGGHCVVPNAKLLNKQFPSVLLKQIIAMEAKE